jgi:hypothetical protein
VFVRMRCVRAHAMCVRDHIAIQCALHHVSSKLIRVHQVVRWCTCSGMHRVVVVAGACVSAHIRVRSKSSESVVMAPFCIK